MKRNSPNEPLENINPNSEAGNSRVLAFLDTNRKQSQPYNSYNEQSQLNQWERLLFELSRPALKRHAAQPEALGSLERLDLSQDDLDLFLIDIDYVTHAPSTLPYISSKLAFTNGEVPVIRLFGATKHGHSVLVHVHGFFPYFYCDCPRDNSNSQDLENQLENHLSSAQNSSKSTDKKVLGIHTVQGKSLMNYTHTHDKQFFKIYVGQPRFVATCRTAIENNTLDNCRIPPISYESNIPFTLRFMVDRSISGCSWLTVPHGKYFERNPINKVGRCQLEIDVYFEDIISHPVEGVWQAIPPLRILSFDIECIKLKGEGFPEPHIDPIIQISSILQIQGQNGPFLKTIFTLDECAPIAGSYVFWFENEIDMMKRWAEFIRALDPDLITGYNSINFDMNYLIERSKALKLNEFRKLSRIISSESKTKDSTFSSKAYGTHENKEINIEGRVQFDILDIIRREYKLKSYTLNYVSFEFLKEQKEDVHYSMIGDLQRGTPETRRRIAVYCLKDALLPLRLIDKLLLLINYVEMARVTGTTLDLLLTRGQQIKVTSQILRKCLELGYFMPTMRRSSSGDGTQYEGATVLEPKKGLYTNPISTLDFASLYPSIMMAHNLCYSTLIPPGLHTSLDPSMYIKTPTSPPHYFIKKELRKGVLPLIVEELIGARKKAKREMAEATDPLTKMVLNGRQLALKISANSVYGYTGATAGGQLPCLEVATSITCFGRDMIIQCKEMVESYFTKANNYKHDAVVVYGDTDSIMVNFGGDDIEESMNLGLDASKKLSSKFISPIKLEFEKVYCPFLLMNKKRYAGLLYTKPDKYDRMDTKGIETVRRDICPLVQQMVDTVLKKLLIDRDVDGAKLYTEQKISDLLQNKIDLSLLVVTKSLGKIDYGVNLPHVELAKKMKKRDEGSAPNVGDRVSYVIVRGSKGQAQYERAEDPIYVLDNNLTVDTQHYLEAIKGPITRIFEGVIDTPESLFTGSHTHSIAVYTPSAGALSKFIKKSLQCISCRAVIKSGIMCKMCKLNKESQTVTSYMQQIRELEIEFNSLWTECQRCQNSLHQDIICINRDCPIFYRRAKVRKDLIIQQNNIERLEMEW